MTFSIRLGPLRLTWIVFRLAVCTLGRLRVVLTGCNVFLSLVTVVWLMWPRGTVLVMLNGFD